MQKGTNGWVYKQKYKLKNGEWQESPNWTIAYYFKKRLIREKISPDKRFSNVVLNKRLLEIAENTHLDKKPETPKMKFKELVDRVMQEYVNTPSEQYYKERFKSLNRHFSEYYIDEINPEMIQKYKIILMTEIDGRKLVSHNTINHNLKALGRAFKIGINWKIVETNPVEKIKLLKIIPKKKEPLEAEEIKQLLQSCDGTIRDILMASIDLGTRREETRLLKWDSVNFELGLIVITEDKENRIKEIPMTNRLRSRLTEIKAISNSEYVFISPKGLPYSKSGLRHAYSRTLDKAGVMRHLTFHNLRDTFGTLAYSSNHDIVAVQKILGHKDIKTTLIYVTPSLEQKRTTIARYEDILEGRVVDINASASQKNTDSASCK